MERPLAKEPQTLFALPIFMSVAAAHRYLALYAPSNVLIRHVRMSPPRWPTVGALAGLTILLILAMRGVELAITAGAYGWLNLLVLVLAWDAIKLGLAALESVVRCLWSARPGLRSTTVAS